MKQIARPALGRGLSALVTSKPVPVQEPEKTFQPPEKTIDFILKEKLNSMPPARAVAEDKEENDHSPLYVSITSLVNDPLQPRRDFKEQELLELADSIKKLGLIQPVLVRPIKQETGSEQKYQIVAGERRWRASKLAGLAQIPVIIKDLTDKNALELAIVENVQREDLNPVEQALSYERLQREFGLSQEEVASRVGKDRASIANQLRLLKLPVEVLDALRNGDISPGHAKVILAIKDASAQISLARKVIKESLSVRELEAVASRMVVLDAGKRSTLSTVGAESTTQKDESSAVFGNFEETIERLRRTLGTKVEIRHQKSGKGKIEIAYYSEQELDRLVQLVCDD